MKLFKIGLGILIAIAVVSAGLFYWFYSTLRTPVEHSKANDVITIEKGSTPNQIISKLAAEGILPGEFAVRLFVRGFGEAEKMQAGEYQFKSPITPMEVLKELEKGEAQTTRLTIPEGFTRFDIAKRIAANFTQEPPLDEKAILALMDDTSLVRDISPTAKNLEGYMYPSTYNIPKKATPQEVVRKITRDLKLLSKGQEPSRRAVLQGYYG